MPRRREAQRGAQNRGWYDGGFYIRSKDKPFSLANALWQFTYTFLKHIGQNSNQTFDVALG